MNGFEEEIDNRMASYLSFTNTTNLPAARAALESVQWNVEAAVEAFYDSSASAATPKNLNHSTTAPSPSPIHRDQLHGTHKGELPRSLSVDGSDQNSLSNGLPADTRANQHSRPSRPYYQAATPPLRSTTKWFNFLFRLKHRVGPLRFLAVPVSLVADVGLTVFGVLGRLLGFRLPSISFHWPRPSIFGWNQSSTHHQVDPRTCAERWVRELEEDLRARSSYTSFQPGDPEMPRLPDFLLMGYDDAVKKAKDELKNLMVVLVSDEHDDTLYFKRNTLMDPELLEVLVKNEILIWGGDVRDRDASFAGQILDATTYPFIGFVSLQAKRQSTTSARGDGSAGRSTANLMAVVTRLEGSPEDSTSARSISSAINTVVLPRTSTILNRLRSEKAKREADRRLREEQDRAYMEAGRRDRERVMKKKAELEAEVRRVEELKEKEAEKEIKKKEKSELEEQRRRWRYWARLERLKAEPDLENDGLTIGFRLGNGKRVIRRFEPDEPLDSLYLFVELESGRTQPISWPSGRPPTIPSYPINQGQSEVEMPRPKHDYHHTYDFKLSTAMPRRMIPVGNGHDQSPNMSIRQFGGLDGANVNVEGNCFQNNSSSSSGSSCSDGSGGSGEEEDG